VNSPHLALRAPLLPDPISSSLNKKRAGLRRPENIGGLNRTRKQQVRPVRAPGGWGAEESGAHAGPDPEATIVHIAGQMGTA